MPRPRLLGPDWDLVEFELNPATGETIGVYDYPKRDIRDIAEPHCKPEITISVRGIRGELPSDSGSAMRHNAGAQIDTMEIPGVMSQRQAMESVAPAGYADAI